LNKPNNKVKIIGGHWKKRNIFFSDNDGLRPTLGRVRETLFNWLNQDLSGRVCLDLYAGSGALGFEALSRNAHTVYMIEKNQNVFQQLISSKDQLKADNAIIIHASAKEFINRNEIFFDVIFFDAPFKDEEQLLLLLSLKQYLTPNGHIYFESDKKFELEDFKIIKSSRAGKVYFYLLQ